jgi:sugar lactone lactonase YvrE
MSEPKVLLSDIGIPESRRWHEGRLWFCNWIERQVVAVNLDGKAEVMTTRDPDSHPMGYSIEWLPDDTLLVTGDKLRRQEPDGSMVVHAEQRANEIVVDGRGNIYLNGARTSTSSQERRPSPAISSSSPQTAIYARSPATSSSPTAWSSRPMTGR